MTPGAEVVKKKGMASDIPNLKSRVAVVVSVLLVIALIHIFRVGTYLSGTLFTLYYSFFSDVIIPFGMYFMLCLNEATIPALRSWRTKSMLVFGAASATEVAQAFGIPLLGETFDPLDFVMFALGTLLAVFADRIVLPRLMPSWRLERGR